MIKAIIFDLDGTLANTEPLHYEAWRETLSNNGVSEFTFETFLQYIGTSNEKVAGDYRESHKIDKSVKTLIREKQNLYMDLIPKIELCLGAKETITHFSSKLKLAVASSSHEKEVRAILKANGLLDFFQAVMCGDMVSEKKPNPEIYLKTAALLQVDPASCIAFEDSSPGLNGAKNAKMVGIAIPNEFTENHDFSRADQIISDFSKVTEEFIAQFKFARPKKGLL